MSRRIWRRYAGRVMWRCIVANRRQKPPEMLQGKGSRFTGTSSLAVQRDTTRPIPIPPTGLRKAAKDSWLDFWRSPMASLVQDDSDMDALRDWAFCVSERDRLRVELKKHPLVPGARGTLIENPLARLIARYTDQINRYRDQFGMTPLSRMRLGVAVGEAHDTLALLAASAEGDEIETFDLSDDVIEVGT